MVFAGSQIGFIVPGLLSKKRVEKSRRKAGLTPQAGVLCPAKTGKQVLRLFAFHDFAASFESSVVFPTL
jgi:hypothetical protein